MDILVLPVCAEFSESRQQVPCAKELPQCTPDKPMGDKGMTLVPPAGVYLRGALPNWVAWSCR